MTQGERVNVSTQEHRALLDLMRADNAAAPPAFRAGAFWSQMHARIEPMLGIGLADVEGGPLNLHFSNVRKNDPRLYAWFLATYYRLLRQRDTLGIFDRFEATTPAVPKYQMADDNGEVPAGTPIEIDGLQVSPDFLFTVRDFYNAHEACPQIATEPVVVCELGAGWGRFGWLLLRVNPRATYVVLDLPETLIVSATHLPILLPDVTAKTYEQARGHSMLDRATLSESRLWFLGSQDIRRIGRGSVDLFVNVSSFQEMESAIVDGYLTEIDRCAEGGVLYTLNMERGIMSGFADYKIPSRWREIYRRKTLHAEDHYEAAFAVSSAPDSRR